jgi:hypothetical protein
MTRLGSVETKVGCFTVIMEAICGLMMRTQGHACPGRTCSTHRSLLLRRQETRCTSLSVQEPKLVSIPRLQWSTEGAGSNVSVLLKSCGVFACTAYTPTLKTEAADSPKHMQTSPRIHCITSHKILVRAVRTRNPTSVVSLCTCCFSATRVAPFACFSSSSYLFTQ